jgi:uncharacterized protein involved in exopolysaccharide biosynthesis
MAATATPIHPQDVLRSLKAHPWRLALPTVVAGVLGLVVALVRTPTWEASQAMIVRDEAAGGRMARPGHFGQLDAMKTVQETILELSHSRTVMERSLREVGPPADYKKDLAAWPAAQDIEDLQDATKLAPPKGAEFGKTELFYLKAQAQGRERAIALASALGRNLQERFEELRKTQAQGVIDELVKTVSLAQTDLDTSTATLTKLESSVGHDLAELRMLNESPAGESDLRKMTVDLETELRTQQSALKSSQNLLKLLKDSQDDPGRLLASPSRLLELQPGLKRLKEGLVDAQLSSAKLEGAMSPDHPMVKAAKESEREISQHLHDELAIAIRGAEGEERLAENRVKTLTAQLQSVTDRRQSLADVRATYANLNAMTKHYTDILKTAQLQLSEARATQAAAHQASLLNLVDLPDTGSRPMPPGKTIIVGGSVLGGLMLGAAWLFLTIQPAKIAEPSAESTFGAAARSSAVGNGNGNVTALPEKLAEALSERAVKEAWRKLRTTRTPLH